MHTIGIQVCNQSIKDIGRRERIAKWNGWEVEGYKGEWAFQAS